MDDLIRAFAGPVGAWGGKGLDDREPPDLATDPMARLVAVLVEAAGGTVPLTRADLEAARDRLMLVVRKAEDALVLETRHLAEDTPLPE